MSISKSRKLLLSASIAGLAGIGSNAMAELDFSLPEVLSENGSASKTKLLRLGNGWLVSPFGDTVDGASNVYDTKKDGVRPARDIFVRACNTNTSETECSAAADWTDPVNISNTALLYSAESYWNEDLEPGTRTPFYGDSDKPNIFAAGSFAVITWVDKFCGDAGQSGISPDQRAIAYVERDGITVPFSCVYVSYTNSVGGGAEAWTTTRLTNGERDAKSDSNKGLSIGTPAVANWVISWQEDPHGLQLGGADGPGDGASGASVTHGTDVWYTYTDNLMSTPFAAPSRVTDNYTNDGSGGNTSPVLDATGVEIEDLERGTAGAARPNLMLVAGSSPPTAVVAYEESKSAERTDSGKFIRYHEFAFNSPPPQAGGYDNGEPGCIISDPLENSRRVRFVAQPTPSSPSGLRMGVFWRQGFPTEGGPADIMVRVGKKSAAAGSTGLRPEDMFPAVDAACRTSVYDEAKLLANVPANNISSNTIPWSPLACEVQPPVAPDNDLEHTSSFNPYEDSRAHRAAIVADDLYVGYSYVKDWAVGNYTDMDNYNFWLRRYNGALNDWTVAKNVSNISDPSLNVKEPRLVKTPGNGPGCSTPTEPETITNPENCQDKNTLIVAWGTESNVYSHVESSEEFDIYYTRTRDKAVSFEDAVVVPGIGENNRFESQLRPTPAGNVVYTVWNEAAASDTNAMLSVSDERGSVEPPPVDYDLLMSMSAPETIRVGAEGTVTATTSNLGPDDLGEDAVVTVTGVTNRGTQIGPFEETLGELASGSSADSSFGFVAPNDRSSSINWTATVSAAGDTDPSNNTATALTRVRR